MSRIVTALVCGIFLLAGCEEPSERDRRAHACGESGQAAYRVVKSFLVAQVPPADKLEFPRLIDVRATKPLETNPCLWMFYGHVDLADKAGNVAKRPYIAMIEYDGQNRWSLRDLNWQ